MKRPRRQLLYGLVLAAAASPARAGEFDRIEGDVLARLAKSEGATPRQSLSFKELDSLPSVLADSRSAFFIVKTSDGNYTRVLASPALRKPSGREGPATPVLVLERFDTFEPAKSGSRLARGAGVVLFDGFQIDLDSGLIVPEGQGGDLAFTREAAGGPTLKAVAPSVLVTLTKPVPAAPARGGPSAGKSVIPGDFSGRYRLFADGRWTGLLEIEVAADRELSGKFRSEANGTSYAVTGRVSAETPQQVTFVVRFPRTAQEYQGYLWTEGKNVLAGTFVMLDRTFGFFAVREGARSPTDP